MTSPRFAVRRRSSDAFADELDDPELRLVAEWKDGPRRCDGRRRPDRSRPRRGGRLRGGRRRLGGDWRHGVPGGLDRRGGRTRLRRRGTLDRRRACATPTRSSSPIARTDALDPGVGVVGRSRPGRCPATRSPGDRRQGLRPRDVHGALGARVRRHDPRRARRGHDRTRGRAGVRDDQREIELILPPLWGLAEVALQAGDAKRASALCRDALDRSIAVDETVLLVAVRGDRGSGRRPGWTAARCRRLARRHHRPPRRDPRRIGCGARPWARPGRPGRRRHRGRQDRPRDGGRRLGPTRSDMGGSLGARRPGPMPGSLESLCGSGDDRDRGTRPRPEARSRRRLPSGRMRCCGWRAATPRTTNRGARSRLASSRSRD